MATQRLAALGWALPLIVAASGCLVTVDDRSGPPPPPPPGPVGGTQLTYDPCATTNDCAVETDACVTVTTVDTTGLTRSGNQCSSFCASDAACAPINGYAGACYMLSTDPDFRNFLCYARCDTSADCASGQECVEVSGASGPDAICLPAASTPPPPPPPVAATYDPCIDSTDCSAVDVCVRVVTTDSSGVTRDGNQCSNFCASDSECTPINGYDGACYMISSDPDFRNFTCFARCDTDADCDFTQDCVTVTGPAGPDAICLPAV